MKVLGIIPARYTSTRFPGKLLHPIAGKPLIQHVVERCKLARSLSEVIVATDDARIREVVRRFCRVEMTRPDHSSGSDRIAEVAARCACDAAVNIQGDEPLIDPGVIDAVAAALADSEMSTAATVIGAPEELEFLPGAEVKPDLSLIYPVDPMQLPPELKGRNWPLGA